MGLKIDDNDTCPQCGAYFGFDDYCASGHPRPYQTPALSDELKEKDAFLRQVIRFEPESLALLSASLDGGPVGVLVYVDQDKEDDLINMRPLAILVEGWMDLRDPFGDPRQYGFVEGNYPIG